MRRLKIKTQDSGAGFRIFRLALLLTAGVFALLSADMQEPAGRYLEPGRIYRLGVPADAAWTDTGFTVRSGQEIEFFAEGGISLQMGNPMAYCGPEGYDLKTLQQPLREENIGSLIGRVALLISEEKDKETGELIRNEIIKEFHIGEGDRIVMPIDGRLFLGINELVVADNAGQFQVSMRLSFFEGGAPAKRQAIRQPPRVRRTQAGF